MGGARAKICGMGQGRKGQGKSKDIRMWHPFHDSDHERGKRDPERVIKDSDRGLLGPERAIREDLKWKKTFSFGHCPNHLNHPPP